MQGIIVLNNPNYVYERWHGTLIMWALLILTFVVNVWFIKLLPLIELLGGICHVTFFIALLVTLVCLAPRSSADFVFTTLLNEGGWKSDGISWCIGLLTVTFCFVGEFMPAPFLRVERLRSTVPLTRPPQVLTVRST